MENLSELYLDGTAIKELPSSMNNLTRLVTLNLKDCRELRILPSNFHIRSLQTLNLSGCSNLEQFSEIFEVMKNLSELHLDWTAIKDMKNPSRFHLEGIKVKELPLSVYNLRGLVTLTLRYSKDFKRLTSSICQLKSLNYLSLSGCTKFEVFPDLLENMERLASLDLDGTSIRELPPSIERLQGLVSLNLKNCKSLVSLPDNICNLPSLEWLTLNGCSKLSMLPKDLWYLKRLDVKGAGIRKDNNHGPTGRYLPKQGFFSTLGDLAQFRSTAPLIDIMGSNYEQKEEMADEESFLTWIDDSEILMNREESSYEESMLQDLEFHEENAIHQDNNRGPKRAPLIDMDSSYDENVLVADEAILSDLETSRHEEENEDNEEKAMAASRRGRRIWGCICGSQVKGD